MAPIPEKDIYVRLVTNWRGRFQRFPEVLYMGWQLGISAPSKACRYGRH